MAKIFDIKNRIHKVKQARPDETEATDWMEKKLAEELERANRIFSEMSDEERRRLPPDAKLILID